MKKLLVFILLCATSLTSCSAGGGEPSHTGEGEKKLPECAPYGTENVSYTAEISDGRRAVTLGVKRTDGISVVTVTTPEELAGTVITDDVEGMRMRRYFSIFVPLFRYMIPFSENAFSAMVSGWIKAASMPT